MKAREIHRRTQCAANIQGKMYSGTKRCLDKQQAINLPMRHFLLVVWDE
jgi:hypothetical protein